MKWAEEDETAVLVAAGIGITPEWSWVHSSIHPDERVKYSPEVLQGETAKLPGKGELLKIQEFFS
ncbi:MAG: hypothetical protein ACR2GY_03340 [Phycisphaerales bacterium]